jgi:predicted dinucleotide-binding enzyme
MSTRDAMKQSRREFLQQAGALGAIVAFGAIPFTAGAAAAPKMKIGVIGSGRVGGTIGSVWAKAGHEVMFSSLNLEQDKALAASVGPNAKAGTTREAAAFGTVLLVSVPYAAVPQLGKDLGDLIKGKVIIDTSNPIPGRDGDMAVAAREKGAGQASAEFLPGARIVRAFNAIGYARMGEAFKTPGTYGMPIAGDDRQAVEIASGLIREVGYEPVLIGGTGMGRHLIPGGPLSGERSPDEVRKIVATLK